ncbi:hypothetical protein CTAYLR_006289 [Chrysophaeum taylorii]|uniref:Centromere/kinetochore protein zw10 C-terminal domain-containing protein n=1 Tax=Chrysophaeum taylorii TaxID=2483200 RepID=A0AAD7UJY3_9STRA|nr:hypothetical protein CTAYLR_006289 [Chrysophaeum taylorii]
MNHHQRLQGIVRRVRRECEEVGETGVEEAVGAEAVVAGLRVELGAALAELGPESTASGYDRERDRLAAEIAACEAQVSRLEAVVRTDRILDEIEALVSSNALSAAAKKLSSFPPRGDDVLRRRKRGLAAALEVRLTDLAAAAIDITASRLVFRHRYAGLIQNAPIDDDDDDDGTSLSSVLRNLGLIGAARRFLRTLAAELEPVLDRAVILTDLSTPDAGELAIEPAPLEEKDAFRTRAASATVWVRFMRETLGLDDETICYLDGWTAKRLEEVVRADASSVDRETLLALDVRPLALPKRLFEEALNTYAQVRATKALDDARDLILGDWHNDSEVDADDILDELEGCAGGRSGGDSFFSEKKKKKGMRVSVLAQEFVAQAERLLQDAVGATAPEAARALFFTTRQLFELYRALFPLAHADTIHAQARMATLFRNDCLFLIRAATRFSVRYCPEIAARGSGDDALLTLVDQLPPLRDLANELLFCPPPAARPA